jgi:hypothetical protein
MRTLEPRRRNLPVAALRVLLVLSPALLFCDSDKTCLGKYDECDEGYRECDGRRAKWCSTTDVGDQLIERECAPPYLCVDVAELPEPFCGMTTSPYPGCVAPPSWFQCDGDLMYYCSNGYRAGDTLCRTCIAGDESAVCTGRLWAPCTSDADCLEGLRCIERLGKRACTVECDCDTRSACSTCAPYGSNAVCLDGWCDWYVDGIRNTGPVDGSVPTADGDQR